MKKFYSLTCFCLAFCIATNAQTFSLLKNIAPGLSEGIYTGPNYLAKINGTFFFNANDGVNGTELWKSDGTTAGTVMLKDISPGAFGSHPRNTLVMGNMLYFIAQDEVHGTEVWKSDGTVAGTVRIKDIQPVLGAAGPQGLVTTGKMLYFLANDGVNGSELWKSDGTEAGTVMVKDINPGIAYSSPSSITPVGDMVYFVAESPGKGKELWKSDGTSAGTVLVKDINPGTGHGDILNMFSLNNTLYFRASPPGENTTLMKTDGTEAGTVVVKPGGFLSGVTTFANIKGVLFFAMGDELWKSDGTASGTELIKDVKPASPIAKNILRITNVNGTAFFSANDGTHGWELWKSDGTAAGTKMIKDINSGTLGSYPETRDMYAVDNMLLFCADDGIHGRELWVSDGTEDGTYMVEDILEGPEGSDPHHIIEIKGRVYITPDDKVAGREVWSACLCFKKRDITNLETMIMLYPNPLRQSGTLMICVLEPEDAMYRIFDAKGRLMQAKRISLSQGGNYINLQTEMLAAGAYFISVEGPRTKKNLKFLKL